MRDRSRRCRVTFAALGLVVLALVGAACSGGPDNRQNSLQPKGPAADKIDNLFVPIAFVAVAIGMLVLGAVLFVAIRYRARSANERPKQIHGSTPIEIGWTLVPAVILAVIAVPTVSLIFTLHEEASPSALKVTAIGKQWWWQFDYAASDGNKQVVTANELHVPVGRQVDVRLRACDASLPGECNVIHSFWVPELAGKTDVVPGRDNHMTFTATKPGTYLGQCAEYCGLSHANMRFRVIAQPPSEFRAWLAAQQKGPTVPLDAAPRAKELFETTFACTNCHTVRDSSASTYGPNLTHVASRTTFASGSYKLNRKNLIDWLLDAPSLIPMESDCPTGTPGNGCVGMPSFSTNPPKGIPKMTRAQAEILADYLLSLT